MREHQLDFTLYFLVQSICCGVCAVFLELASVITCPSHTCHTSFLIQFGMEHLSCIQSSLLHNVKASACTSSSPLQVSWEQIVQCFCSLPTSSSQVLFIHFTLWHDWHRMSNLNTLCNFHHLTNANYYLLLFVNTSTTVRCGFWVIECQQIEYTDYGPVFLP